MYKSGIGEKPHAVNFSKSCIQKNRRSDNNAPTQKINYLVKCVLISIRIFKTMQNVYITKPP